MVLQKLIANGAIALAALSNLGRPTSETPFLHPEDAIQSDAYFYGASPPVYPSPLGNGTGDWGEAYAKAERMVAQLTMDEKIALTGGSSEWTGCDGNIAPIPRVGFPGLCLKDASNGLRQIDFVNGYPSGIHVGASWNKDLTYLRANHMAREFRAKGVNLLLGPTIGPMGRVIRGGRNWESFSIDPYLSGQLVQETVTGIQNTGVMASTKHFLGNEQETNRQDSATASRGANPGIEGVSVNMDDKTMHELYLWPFQDAVKAGSGSIMCSYNRLNNSYACQNSKLLNGLLKSELGFQGYVLTDWEGQHSGVASALAGLDMTMPSPKDFWGESLALSVRNGSVSEARLDDMAKRVLAPWYKMGQNEGFPSRGIHFEVDAKDPASKQVLFDGAVEGHVLVKNEGNILPLKSPRMLSIYGYDAKTPDVMNGDLPNRGIKVQAAMSGTLLSGGGSAAITPARVSSPYSALEQRSYEDNTSLYSDFVNENPRVHGNSDACLVFINAWAEEDWDRPGIQDDYSNNLVNNVANGCANTIVVIHSAGIRLVDRFQSHPNVKAIIFGHLPGQDSGRALVSLLYGDENFSGKLPYTVAQTEADYRHLLHPDQPEGIYAKFPQSNFSEGVFVDYRAFDKYNITPRYEFGFGLSYTTFQYSNLETGLTSTSPRSRSPSAFPTGEIQQGGQVDLWDTIAHVRADVQNVGARDGKEVVQLYVGIPGDDAAPVRQLRGFVKKHLAVGRTARVNFALTRRDLSVWDPVAQKWNLQRGQYKIWVGSSSRILPLTGILSI